MLDSQRVKRIAVYAIILLAVVFFAFQLHRNAVTGKVSVTVDRKDGYIKVLDQNGLETAGVKQYSGQKLQKLTERLKPGKYTVLAYTKSSYTNKIISVKARQSISLSLKLDAAHSPEPVVSSGALGVFASSNELYFIDALAKNLRHINSQGDISQGDPAHVLTKARWASSGLGIAQDRSANLYVINNGVLSSLPLPFPANNNPSVSFDIAPNGTIYLTNGQDIFAGNSAGGFTKIYSSGDNYNIALAASNNGVAFVEKYPAGGPSSLVVLKDGVQKRAASNANQLAWSPGGNYIAASDGKKTGVIYDSSLGHRYVLPNLAPSSLAWSNEKSLLYYASNAIWSYSISDQQSKVITNLIPGDKVSAQAVSSDQSYLYFSVSNSGKLQLFRLGLNGQPVNSSLTTLDVFLPEDIGVCSLSYINFTKPVITIRYPDSGTDPALCVKAAGAELRHYNIDPDKFNYITIPYEAV
jgi:hypothetical protein